KPALALVILPVIAPMTGRTERRQSWVRVPGIMIQMCCRQIDGVEIARPRNGPRAMRHPAMLTAPARSLSRSTGELLPSCGIEPSMLHASPSFLISTSNQKERNTQPEPSRTNKEGAYSVVQAQHKDCTTG